MGAKKKILENGFEVAGFRRSKICVNDQRRPDKAEARITRKNPIGTKWASEATIIKTPIVMMVMIPTSFQVSFSRRNITANKRTKPRTEDLHIAINWLKGY